MAQSQRADWGDDWGDSDDWGNGGGGAGGRRAPAGKPDYNIVLNDDPSYGRNNYNDSAYPQPPAYGDAHRQLPGQVPAPAANMDYGREAYSSPWYRKKRTWAAAALAIIIVIVVPVAVVVSRNNERENSYPDYSPLNYTLLETCEPGPAAIQSGAIATANMTLQIRATHSSITLIISPGTTRPRASSIMSPKRWQRNT